MRQLIGGGVFKDSSFTVGNLETPISNASLSEHQIIFNAPKEYLDAIKSLGVGLVSTANNHCLDRGIQGIDDTLNALDERGILHVGTYSTKEDAEAVVIKEIAGVKFAFVACTYGTNSEVNGNILSADDLWRVDLLKRQNKKSRIKRDASASIIDKYIPDNVAPVSIGNPIHECYIESIKDKISRAKIEADIVVVLPHMGGQYNPMPASYTRHMMHLLANTETDIIIGGHPHVAHGYEMINGKFCAYSLGNFSFTPGVGYYLPNVLAEYGLVYHTYWNQENKTLESVEFELVYNFINEDGIPQVVPAKTYFDNLTNLIERDRFKMETDAVIWRVLGKYFPEIKPAYTVF